MVVDYTQPLPILDLLYADPTRYVTRSVANHLNDISKIAPGDVITRLRGWQDSGAQQEKEMDFITNHSLRTLIKKGDQDALTMIGFGGKPNIEITEFTIKTPAVVVGNACEFTLRIMPKESQGLLIDYLMDFAGDGKKGGKKIFKLKQVKAEAGKEIVIRKNTRLS